MDCFSHFFQSLIKRMFQIVVLISLLVIILTPFNQIGQPFQNVTKTGFEYGYQYVTFDGSSLNSANIGDRLNFYRFNPEWYQPIGQVQVIQKNHNNYKAMVIDSSFVFPSGVQGNVIGYSNKKVEVNIGSNEGLILGQTLILFYGQNRVGESKVIEVGKTSSIASITYLSEKFSPNQILKFQSSIYIVPNAVYLPTNTFIRYFQWSILMLVVGLWLCTFFGFGKNIWPTIAKNIQRMTKVVFQNSARFWLILIGLPITYVLGALLWYLITHLNWVISIHFFHISVKHYPDVGIWPTRILMAGLYYFLLFKNINPLIYVYRSFDYKPQAFFGVSKGLRPYLIWALHLIVFWAFAYTLGTVITINLRSIVNIGWGNFIEKSAVITPWLFGWLDDLVPSISHENFFWDHIFEILVHIINEPMNSLNSQSMFYMMRLVLWSITITLCLSFYCYSVFSILWSRKFIRNIDFTLAGWVTTGICYSPLLAGVLYQITPNVNGVIPNFDVDAWKWMTLICELLLNLLYTLTVFNMGKKFGVLVDKGVIKTGFYAVIRHPSYLLEVMMFIMISIVALSGILQWMAILALIIKYWFRAEREDQFMSGSNPEYLVYKKQVPFKFIPGVY